MYNKFYQVVSKYDELETKFLSDIHFQIPEDNIIYPQLKYLDIIQKNQSLNIYPDYKSILIKINNKTNNVDNTNIKMKENFFLLHSFINGSKFIISRKFILNI